MSISPICKTLLDDPFYFADRLKFSYCHIDDKLTVPKAHLDCRADFCFSDSVQSLPWLLHLGDTIAAPIQVTFLEPKLKHQMVARE